MKVIIALTLCAAVCYAANVPDVPLEDIKYSTGDQKVEAKGVMKTIGGKPVEVFNGDFDFTAPDTGKTYHLDWTADERGFIAKGDHLPTPPPLPVVRK